MEAVFALPDMIPDIVSLWMDAFPTDTKQNIFDFLSAAYKPERCLVMMDNGKPVSMVFMLNAEMEFNEIEPLTRTFSLQYIYAAATLSVYRGQGIFGKLLNHALKIAKERAMQASVLRPAEPGLFSYYSRFGYRPFFWTATEKYSRKQFISGIQDIRKSVCTARSDEWTERRRLLQNNRAWVRWPDYLINYALDSAKQNGGGSIAVDGGWALCEPAGSFLMIREWLCEPYAEDILRHAVAERFHEDTVVLRRPAKQIYESAAEPFGMICPLTNEADRLLQRLENQCPYMGLAFD